MDVKNIFQKICDELGGDYRMFFCNSPTPLQSEAFNLALATPKVVGVGYVSNGNYIPLVDSTAEQVTLFIEFGVPTKQTEQRLAEIEAVITELNAKYGEITYVNDSVLKTSPKFSIQKFPADVSLIFLDKHMFVLYNTCAITLRRGQNGIRRKL